MQCKSLLLAAIGLSVPLMLVGAACGGGDSDPIGDPDATGIESTIRGAVDAWSGRDVNSFVALYTEDGLKQSFADIEDQSPAGLKEGIAVFMADETLKLIAVSNVNINGEQATAEIRGYSAVREDPSSASVVTTERDRLVKVGDAWKLDTFESISAPNTDKGDRIGMLFRCEVPGGRTGDFGWKPIPQC